MSIAPTNGKASWQLALTAAGVIGAFVTAILSANSQFAEVRAEQAISKTERTEIRDSLGKLSISVAVMREDLVALKSGLAEIETQFRGTENTINLHRAESIRTTALIWEKVFGARYPSDAAYYPSISQPK